jgi:hypothetical protein
MLMGSLLTSRELQQGVDGDTRYTDRMTMVLARVAEQPEVAAVTYAERFPGGAEWRPSIEAEGDVRIRSRVNMVAPNLFEVFDVHPIAGRGFTAGDMQPETLAAIVDQEFAERLAPGANVIGRRVRFPAPDGENPNPWMEIVGVVPVFSNQFTAPGYFGKPVPSLYVAGGPGRTHPATLIIKVRSGDPARYEQKLQEITASVDPTMRVEQVMGVVDQWHHDTRAYWMMAVAIVAVTASVLLLSAAGIYAMMSFTVARRWREIGIRVALGADARRVLMGIFGRASAQIAVGVAAGLVVAGVAEFMTPGGNIGGRGLVLFPAVVVVMFVVGTLAAAGPARRGLAVQPTEALRNE